MRDEAGVQLLEWEWRGCGAQGEAAGEGSEQQFLVFCAKAALMV